MIMFYFSGTGNSKYIAELFCNEINASCYSIEEDADFEQLILAEETIGFCYPIYFSRVPRMMREFVSKNMDALHGKKVIIFCTQQILSGDGARALTDLFPRDYIQVIYAEHFFMPSNIFPITTNADKIKKHFKKSKLKLQSASRNIANGKVKKRGFNIGSSLLGFIQAPLFLPFEKRANESIKVTYDCNKCGLCVSDCPMKNLVLENNLISHDHNCTACYRCVNMCPQKAITVAFHWEVKKQYGGLYYA